MSSLMDFYHHFIGVSRNSTSWCWYKNWLFKLIEEEMCSKVSINLITTDLIKIDVFLVHYTSSILYNHLYAEMSNLSKQNCKSCKMSNAILFFWLHQNYYTRTRFLFWENYTFTLRRLSTMNSRTKWMHVQVLWFASWL